MTNLATLSDEALQTHAGELLGQQAQIRQENQILYYQPASDRAEQIIFSKASIVGVGGGNRASKTESCLVIAVACATGIFPMDYREVFGEMFRGPIKVRLCVQSLGPHYTAIISKLMWWRWQGSDQPGGTLGHWGWIPRTCLKNGEWVKSWSDKYRTLKVHCRNPDNPDEIIGESEFQIMSYDQEAAVYASDTFHIIIMDEPPPYDIWRENQARVLDVNGRIFLPMTWKDDPSIPLDWIFDEVYEKGQPGPMKDPNVDWFEILTLENRFINRDDIAKRTASWSDDEKKVRLLGQPLRFSNRIHPLFTDQDQTWCFACGKTCLPVDRVCGCERKSTDLVEFNHVVDFQIGENWPVICLLDPHPRKPHMLAWVAVDPADDLYLVAEAQTEGDAADVKICAENVEEGLGLDVRLRLMDPNMGRSPSGARREVNWQDEFDEARISFDLADNSEVGRQRVNQYLKPDPKTFRPRLVIHPRCQLAISQIKRHVWDDFRRTMDRGQKQSPKDKYDDYPDLLKYCMNWEPTFRMLYAGAPVIQRMGKRSGPY